MSNTANCQKIKLLKIMELLIHESDENHPLTTSALCKRLRAMGISCDRRTLYKDIALMQEAGYNVHVAWVRHEKAYYSDFGGFSEAELRILLDAVQAAVFISPHRSRQLTDKLMLMTDPESAEHLRENPVVFNTRKHSNESVCDSVELIEQAIRLKRRISFLYFDIDPDARRRYRRGKRRYVAEPLSLIYHEDRYYLLCYSARHLDRRSTYRVDRMDSVRVESAPVSELVASLEPDADLYTEQSFRMFGGRLRSVTLDFDPDILNAVFDKFGEAQGIVRRKDGRLSTTARVRVSPTFFGWVFGFGGKMTIRSPQGVVNEFQQLLSSFDKQAE